MQKVGMSVFRTLVPFDRIMADERSRVLFENEESGFLVSTRSNKGVQFVTYPCRRLVSLAAHSGTSSFGGFYYADKRAQRRADELRHLP